MLQAPLSLRDAQAEPGDISERAKHPEDLMTQKLERKGTKTTGFETN